MSNREEPLILSIETATRAGSIALLRGRQLLASRRGDATRSHSTDLLQLIRDALSEGGHKLPDVELFAVATGPGSFTGLRIGVATAKGLASTLERKVVGVQTLYAVALAGAGEYGEPVLALLPAGRGEVFAQLFSIDKEGAVTPLDEPTHIAPPALFEKYGRQRPLRWAGEGARAQSRRIAEAAASEVIPFADENSEMGGEEGAGWVLARGAENLASYVGLLAFEKHSRGESKGPEDLHAIYVRPSDAELKIKCRTQG